MRKSTHPAIRELLRAHPDGLTTTEIALLVPALRDNKAAAKALHTMPDAYIDRWYLRPGSRAQYTAVWCVVVPPPNCPYPTNRFDKARTHWQAVQPHA